MANLEQKSTVYPLCSTCRPWFSGFQFFCCWDNLEVSRDRAFNWGRTLRPSPTSHSTTTHPHTQHPITQHPSRPGCPVGPRTHVGQYLWPFWPWPPALLASSCPARPIENKICWPSCPVLLALACRPVGLRVHPGPPPIGFATGRGSSGFCSLRYIA